MNRCELIGLISTGLVMTLSLFGHAFASEVVINEVHHDAVPKTERVEFVELYNAGESGVDLSGWQIEGVGNYIIPVGTNLESGEYLVVAEDAAALRRKYRILTSHEYSGRLENDGERLRLVNAERDEIDRVDYKSGFPWPTGARGAGASMELVHPSLDNDLGGSWRSAENPTPGKRNSVYSANSAPKIRQVKHVPVQPRASESVSITAKVTDRDGVAHVVLSYQILRAGHYIRRNDPAYETSWVESSMRLSPEDGADIYRGNIQAELHEHRSLVRYRIRIEDRRGNDVTVPYPDDEAPNFAYFVYDGVPAWRGSKRPRVTQPVEFSADLMSGPVPVYHLIADRADVADSQYNRDFDGTRMWGTLVYDGIVYDHIRYYNRGEASTYVSGKNKWRIRFNRARDFRARDNYGKTYRSRWKTLNLNACSSPWLASNRGIAGLDEAVPHRLHQLAGVMSSNTHWLQFRVIDAESEAPPNQYSGDLWGLYLAVEHPDNRFLDQRDLPDRSIYKIERNSGDKKNQGASQVVDDSDWTSFWNESGSRNTEAWWRTNFDLDVYFGFRAINRATGNVDLREGANYYAYQDERGRWSPMPWDLDMMFAPVKHIWSGVLRAERCLEHPQIRIEFRNRCREILDLLFSDMSPYGGQAAQLVRELSTIVSPSITELSLVDVDEFMWSYNSRTSQSHRGPWYELSVNETRLASPYRRTIPSSDHEGFQQSIVAYMYDTRDGRRFRINDGIEDGYGFGFLNQEAFDANIPDRPQISYSGSTGFPVDALRFSSSSFSGRNGDEEFSGMEWRLGEISNPTLSGHSADSPWGYEIEDLWNSGIFPLFVQEIEIPVSKLRVGGTYRARVRHFDSSGRASHWSEAIEFVASESKNSLFRDSLVISEIMFRPTDEARAEFIELYNAGSESLDLTGVRFTEGIDFDFSDGEVIDPGEYMLVVGNERAFETRYGRGLPVVGIWEDGDRLSNNGERLILSSSSGVTIHDFEYLTTPPWPSDPVENGHSLTFVPAGGEFEQGNPKNWQSSNTVGGTPGRGEDLPLGDWLAANGLSTGEELSDHDKDGLPALVEYGVGGDPWSVDAELLMKLVVVDDQVHFVFRHARNASGVQILAEFTSDLRTWLPAEFVSVQRGGVDTVTVRSPIRGRSDLVGFFRIRGSRILPVGHASTLSFDEGRLSSWGSQSEE